MKNTTIHYNYLLFISAQTTTAQQEQLGPYPEEFTAANSVLIPIPAQLNSHELWFSKGHERVPGFRESSTLPEAQTLISRSSLCPSLQYFFPRYRWENMWTPSLSASKSGHRCLTILMQSFNYSISAHFQTKSLAKVKVKVVPVLSVCLFSSTTSDCWIESGVRFSFTHYTTGAILVLLLQGDGHKFLVNYLCHFEAPVRFSVIFHGWILWVLLLNSVCMVFNLAAAEDQICWVKVLLLSIYSRYWLYCCANSFKIKWKQSTFWKHLDLLLSRKGEMPSLWACLCSCSASAHIRES